jgi:hypothetical protein
VGVLRKEAIAGVDRIHVRNFGGANEAVNLEIALGCGGFADADGFVGYLHVHGVDVGFGVDGDGADVQFLAGANDADSDFAAVGYEYFLEHALSVKKVAPRGGVTRLIGPDFEQRLAEFDRLRVFDEHLSDDAFDLGFDFVHHFHGFDDADDGVGVYFRTDFDVGGRFWRR